MASKKIEGGNVLPVVVTTDSADETLALWQALFGNASLLRDGVLEVRHSDDPMWGNRGPLQQREKEMALQPSQELMTYDSNMERVFGTSPIVDPSTKRLQADIGYITRQSFGRLAKANDEVRLNVIGMASCAFQLYGTFSMTGTFEVSLDGQNWINVQPSFPFATPFTSGTSTIATGPGIYKLTVADISFVRIRCLTYTSGLANVIINAEATPGNVEITKAVTAAGDQANLRQSKVPYELATADSVLKETLFVLEPWLPNVGYSVGDVVFFNGRVYRCISGTTANGSSTFYPTNASYWVLEQRPSRSLATNLPASPPDATRLRVEVDLDAYQYRMQEMQMVNQALQMQNDMIFQDYDLTINQMGVGGAVAKNHALGRSGMSFYNFTEIR